MTELNDELLVGDILRVIAENKNALEFLENVVVEREVGTHTSSYSDPFPKEKLKSITITIKVRGKQ